MTRNQQRIGGGIVIGQPTLTFESDQRRVVLVTNPKIERDLRRHLPLVVKEAEGGPMPRARINNRQVAPDAAWNIQQEARKRIGKAIGCKRVGRRSRLRTVEFKTATWPETVLHLQEEVAVGPQVAAKLNRVIAEQLRQHRRDLGRALGPIPRETRRKPHHWPAIERIVAGPPDEDAGDAANALPLN